MIGRPKEIDDVVLRKLEYAFIKGLSDREACDYADIAPSTLYKYCKEYPEFSERKEMLKDRVKTNGCFQLKKQKPFCFYGWSEQKQC